MITSRRNGTRIDCTLTESQHRDALALSIDRQQPLLFQVIPNAVPFWQKVAAANGVDFLTINWPDVTSPDFTGVVK